ncbi:hypothetical protein HJC23_012055 [Cyclotella cryptica]|uniref:Uncharacterized protein n=1 Tax=Cyclotella cryptica TaxID=29204 RepID=A0ABD3NWG5_9STRA|eukprot:CCRYP_019329-RA/>CCRYP_019329-RA protein AED:0.02 eAED:0.02 QI:644/1/1/1/0/0/2/375/439
MTRNYKTLVHSAPNLGTCSSDYSPSRSSICSVQSRTSSSIYSETSSSRGSDYIFGSDNYGNIGAFPHVSPPPCKISNKANSRKNVNHVNEHHQERRRLDALPVLQKSAMSAFLASPSPNRWSDLVRTMRVESRINSLGFTSLHDDIDKMVDDCMRRNYHDEENGEGAHEFQAVGTSDVMGLQKTFSKVTDTTESNTSTRSPSNSSTSSTCEDESNPSDESFTFTAKFPNDVFNEIEEHDFEPEDSLKEQGKISPQVKLAMEHFIRDPSSHNAWIDLVDLFREDKMKEDRTWGECPKLYEEKLGKAEKRSNQYIYDTVDSGKDWANFDDITNDKDTRIVQDDISFHQQCAMEAFLQQPSQDKWMVLVRSFREEKARNSEEACASLLRLQSKLEKLEEEASAAERSWDKELGTEKFVTQNDPTQSKVDKVDFFDQEICYAV